LSRRFDPPEFIFVVEASGTPLVAFPAENVQEADCLRREIWFVDELRSLTSQGRRIWDGGAKLVLRQANKSEEERFHKAARGLFAFDKPLVYLVELDWA
jgi:hypothetical protein